MIPHLRISISFLSKWTKILCTENSESATFQQNFSENAPSFYQREVWVKKTAKEFQDLELG